MGSTLQINSILLSENLPHQIDLKYSIKYLQLVNTSQTPMQGHLRYLFKTRPSSLLTTFGMIADNVASLVIGWRAEG